MLTKELLNYRVRQGKVTVQFLDNRDSQLLAFADQLLATAQATVGQRLYCFDTRCSEQGLDLHPQAAGFKKILRSHFVCDEDATVAERRWSTFLHAQLLRQEEYFPTHHGFQAAFAQSREEDFATLAADLYSDLPEQRLVKCFASFSPRHLIDRYNCAQVQGLLFFSNEISLKITAAPVDAKRALFRALKFHRLLAEITSSHSHASALNDAHLAMTISGPLGLFQKNMPGYGLRLANFFPHLPLLPQWEFTAQLTLPHKKGSQFLHLDQKAGLNSHYKQQGSYLPEEFAQLIEGFNEKRLPWQLAGGGDCINIGRQNYCVPDFVFTYRQDHLTSPPQIYGELFHKWHWRHVIGRVKAADIARPTNLIVGICRSIAKRPEIAEVLANSPWFKQYGFTFKEFPSIKTLYSTLRQFESI